MIIGILREIAKDECRVGGTPNGVARLVAGAHRVLVERGAGAAIGFTDEEYLEAGATIVTTASEIFDRCELIVKVRELQAPEYTSLRAHHTLFSNLNLAANEELAFALAQSGASCIAWEEVTDSQGCRYPLLEPMSAIAGQMAIQIGARQLEQQVGGRAIWLGGAPGAAPGRVVVLGAGVAGQNAARMALAAGAYVVMFEQNSERLAKLAAMFKNRVAVLYPEEDALNEAFRTADLIIGSAHIHGERAPKLITRRHLAEMKTGTVIIDIAIDQGGCAETSQYTSHSRPTFEVDGIIHYGVPNMPAAVGRTATLASHALSIDHVVELSKRGWLNACRNSSPLRHGLAVARGKLTNFALAHRLAIEHASAADICKPNVA